MGRLLDIEYIYEAGNEAAPAREHEDELTAAMLADLPEELLQELRETTLVLNMETILEVIDRIEAHAPETAKGLRDMVENFKMVRIQYLLGEVGEKLRDFSRPIKVLIPEKGFTKTGQPGGLIHDPESDQGFREGLESWLTDHPNPNLTIETFPYYINEPAFAASVCTAMVEVLGGP